MTEAERSRCHAVIHSHALAAGAGNVIPAPGAGFAFDAIAITSMTAALCSIFGGDIGKETTRSLGIAALKNTMLKAPLRTATKELTKLLPFAGQAVAPALSVSLLEAAGWSLARELDARRAH